MLQEPQALLASGIFVFNIFISKLKKIRDAGLSDVCKKTAVRAGGDVGKGHCRFQDLKILCRPGFSPRVPSRHDPQKMSLKEPHPSRSGCCLSLALAQGLSVWALLTLWSRERWRGCPGHCRMFTRSLPPNASSGPPLPSL